MFKSKIFVKTMFLMVAFLAAYAFVISLFIFPRLNDKITNLEENGGKLVLSKVVKIIENAHGDLKDFETNAMAHHKVELKNLTDTVWSMIDQRYTKDPSSKQEVLDLISEMRYDKNNYFYISDYNSVLISHPYLKNKDMSNIKDINGNLIVPPMVKLAKEKGEGFHSYWWKKNVKDDTPLQKLTFSKHYPKWDMVLGTGVYIDDIGIEVEKRKEELLKQLRDIITTTKISKTGYLFVFDKDGNMLIHPNENLDGKNIKKLINPGKGTLIFNDLIRAAHDKKSNALYYKWDKPEDPGKYIYDKVSWTTHIPEFGWYISSSAYVEEFNSTSKNLINYIMLIGTILTIISLIISYKYLKKLLKPISTLATIAQEVSNGNYHVKAKIKSDDEIGKLGTSFNNMIDTIKDNIDNLDNRIKEKTEQLDNEKHFIRSIMNSQSSMVVTCYNNKLETVNKAFLKFFNVNSLEDFNYSYGECISDTFDPNSSDEYIKKEMPDNQDWVDYIIENKNIHHKVIINNYKPFTFSVTADRFIFNGREINTITFTDIEELENAKLEAEMILKSILLPVLITNNKTRKIVYANKYAETQYDTSLEKMIGSDMDDLYSMKGQQTHLIEALKTKGYVDNFEETFVTKSGRSFTALLSVIPIIYHQEPSYIGMVTDITKQKEVEAEVRKANKHIHDSIEYASLIQGALIPDNRIFEKYFNDFFAVWQPKDIVGGDIYLVEELRGESECLIMAIDCTGHGVPGAFVTMLVKAIERQIIAIINNNDFIEVSPAWILSYFNRTIKTLLKQEDADAVSNAGFDGGVIHYSKELNQIKFAGAQTPLFYIDPDSKKIQIVKGDRHSVGYKSSDADFEFTEHTIDVKEGMKFYITSDGYIDQNGGEKDFPFGKKRFKALIENNQDLSFEEQKDILMEELLKYQGDQERNDDVSLIGIKI